MASKTIGTLAVKLGLDKAEFTKNLSSVNRELKTAKAEFDVAGNGLTNFGSKSKVTEGHISAFGTAVNLQNAKVSEYKNRLENAKGSLDSLQKSQADTTKELETARAKVDALKNSQERNNSEMEEAEATVKQLEASYDKNTVAMESARRTLQQSEAQYASATAEAKRYEIQMKELESRYQMQNSSMYQFGEKLEGVGDGMIGVGGAMETAGKTIGIASAAVAGGVGYAVKTAIDFESAWTGVLKTVDASPEMLEKLRVGFKDLSEEIPMSVEELYAIGETAGQLGVAEEYILGFTDTIAKMAVTTDMTSEAAAMSFAKIENVVGFGQENFDRLGSSIVHLGNNYATTETAIMEMTQRLSGAGSVIGLTMPQITGIATALSSVGIEAEMGGSAFSKVFVKMEAATKTGLNGVRELEAATGLSRRELEMMASVDTKGFKEIASSIGMTTQEMNTIIASGKELEGFANVAGMSIDEFAQKFEVDAVGALGAFIDGLADTERHGESAIELLQSMGFNEVRLRDALLRTQNAQGLMNDAVADSTKAWEENTAMTDEANLRFGTTESQLEIARNKLRRLAAEFGENFLPVLVDLLEEMKPFLETLKGMVERFTELDPATKKTAMKFMALIAAASPLLILTGKLVGGTGHLVKGFGTMAKTIVDVSTGHKKYADMLGMGSDKTSTMTKITAKAAEGLSKMSQNFGTANAAALAAKTGVGSVATTGAQATGIMGALGAKLGAAGIALSSLAIPAAVAAGAIVAVAGSVKLYQAYQEEQARQAKESYELNEKWGTKVTEAQNKVLEKTYELRDEGVTAFNQYIDGTKSAEEVVETNNKISDSIKKITSDEESRHEKMIELMKTDSMKQYAQQYLDGLKEQNALTIQEVESTVGQINSVIQSASDNNREITDAEHEYVMKQYSKLSTEQMKAYGISAEMRYTIEQNYQEKTGDLSDKQLKKRSKALRDALDEDKKANEKMLGDMAKAYGKDSKEYKDMKKMQAEAFRQSTEEMAVALYKVMDAQGKTGEHMNKVLEKYGWDVINIEKIIMDSTKKSKDHVDFMATGFTEANMEWNELLRDPVTGEFRTNLADFLLEITEGESTWSALHFYAKDATLNTNAKDEIAVAVGMAGEWDELTPEEKDLLVNGDQAKLNIFETINHMMQWDSFNIDRKELGIDQANAVWALLDTQEKINGWNQLDVETKKLVAENEDLLNKVIQSEENLQRWNAIAPESKQFMADNTDVALKVLQSEEDLNRFNVIPMQIKRMLADGINLREAIDQGILDVETFNVAEPHLKYFLGENHDLLTKTAQGGEAIGILNATDPLNKNITADNKDILDKTSAATGSTDTFNREVNFGDKTLKAIDEFSDTIGEANRQIDAWNRDKEPKTKTVKTIFQQITQFFTEDHRNPLHEYNGTNYFPGGLALVNDQLGNTFKELITLPTGESFIPEGRNVMLDLPRGTKIMRANLTKSLVGAFANGVGYSPTEIMNAQNTNKQETVNNYYSINVKVEGSANERDSTQFARKIMEEIKRLERNSNHARGIR